MKKHNSIIQVIVVIQRMYFMLTWTETEHSLWRSK